MKQFILYIVLCTFINCVALGQQLGTYGNFALNASNNPALAGLEKNQVFQMAHRNQWMPMDNSPSQQVLSFSKRIFEEEIDSIEPFALPISNNNLYKKEKGAKPIKNYLPHGLGLNFSRDAYGPFANLNLTLNYAYHLKLNDAWNFSIGAGPGISYLNIDEEMLSVTDPNDAVYQEYIGRNTFGVYPNIAMGFSVYRSNTLVAYSANQLLRNRPFSANVDLTEYQLRLQHSILAMHIFEVSNGFELAPQIQFLGIRGIPASTNFGIRTRIADLLIIAANYSTDNAASLRFGVVALSSLQLNYTYGVNTNQMLNYGGSTHEISLCWFLNSSQNLNYKW